MIEEDFDSTLKECKSQIDSAANIITKKNIKSLEGEFENGDGNFETISKLETSVHKLLEIGVTKEDALNNISKILEQIQLGKCKHPCNISNNRFCLIPTL